MSSSSSLPWWKRILVDEPFRKQITFIATEIYKHEQVILEKYPERITHDCGSNKERNECEVSCVSWPEQEVGQSCTSQFLFLRSTDKVATHHPHSIINTSSYSTQHAMLLPTVTKEQHNAVHHHNDNENGKCNAEGNVNESETNKDFLPVNSTNNPSTIVANYLHRIRRYSTETSEQRKKCDARDVIHHNLTYHEARDVLSSNNNNNHSDRTSSTIKNRKGVYYFPSIESVENDRMWARVTEKTPYAKLFALKSARTQVEERKQQFIANQLQLHNNTHSSCNSTKKKNEENDEIRRSDKIKINEDTNDEMHFRRLLARSCVNGANNLYGLSYYWDTCSSSHETQLHGSNNSGSMTNIWQNDTNSTKCNLPPAGFIRVNPDPRYAMWPDIDGEANLDGHYNEYFESLSCNPISVHQPYNPKRRKNWERFKEYVNKRNAKLVMLRAHGCEITMNMLHDNSYSVQDKELEQWMNETKHSTQEMLKSTGCSSQKFNHSINEGDISNDNLEIQNSTKSSIKPFRHNPLFINFMQPVEQCTQNEKNNCGSTKRKWQCVGTFRQSQLLILYKVYCVALHKYSTLQNKRQEQKEHVKEIEKFWEMEEVDLTDVPFLPETESVYKVSWCNTKTLEPNQAASRKDKKRSESEEEEKDHEYTSHYLRGLIPSCPTHMEEHNKTNTSFRAGSEMKWQWWWDYLHNSSLLARQALRDIYNCLPLNSERELGADGYLTFVESVLNLFFPTYVGSKDLYCRIAHEEWIYRGTAEAMMSFNTFFEKFFAFPFIFMRDLAATTEQDYVEFWTLVRICLYGDNVNGENTYFFTHLPYLTSAGAKTMKQLRRKKDEKTESKMEMECFDWSAHYTKFNNSSKAEEREKEDDQQPCLQKSLWKLTRPSLLGANFSKRRLSLLVPLQHFTVDQLRYLNTYPYKHLAPRNNTQENTNSRNWQANRSGNEQQEQEQHSKHVVEKEEEEEEVIKDITTLHLCKKHLYDDPLAASFIRSKLFTLQEKDRFNRTLSSTIMNSERFLAEHGSSKANVSANTSIRMIDSVPNDKNNDENVQEKEKNSKEQGEVEEKEKREKDKMNDSASTHLPLIEQIHPPLLVRQHRSIRIATAGNSRRRMLREAETRIKLKNLLNHSYMYARRRVNLARKLHNKLSSLEATSSSWNLYKDDVYALPLRSQAISKKENLHEQSVNVDSEKRLSASQEWQNMKEQKYTHHYKRNDTKQNNTESCGKDLISIGNYYDDNKHNVYEYQGDNKAVCVTDLNSSDDADDDVDDIDELLNYVADVDDEVFDNKQVSLRDRFKIHKNYTKLMM